MRPTTQANPVTTVRIPPRESRVRAVQNVTHAVNTASHA